MTSPRIAAVMMGLNEEDVVMTTLSSIASLDEIVFYDTGSSDNTISIVRSFAESHDIPLHLLEGQVNLYDEKTKGDFSTTRNTLLNFANETATSDFFLLLDCNDEARRPDKLREFCETADPNVNAWLCRQEWSTPAINVYFNVRLIRPNKGWTYKGSVHEFISNGDDQPGKVRNEFTIYQDRTVKGAASTNRYKRDLGLLLRDHANNPQETRTVFYLAQTYECLGDREMAFFYYKLRAEMDGFLEEKFHACMRAGHKASGDESIKWFMKALEVKKRAEPLCRLATHYRLTGNNLLAYSFARAATLLPKPVEDILFTDPIDYDYTRWHELSIVAYYVAQDSVGPEAYGSKEKIMAEGRYACNEALQAGGNRELDVSNSRFYE